MLNKNEWINAWLTKAKNDLKTAERVIDSEDPLPDIACYHAQQCVEKCLKGFLTSQDVVIEKTHDLIRLNNLCCGSDQEFCEINDICIFLTPYGVETRYPGELGDYSVEEAKDAVENARKVYSFVISKLNKNC
ncbi:MAG TPA: HEPN domain-containing protein [Bacillota bacterium]|nr:HEPN domain-containing protein [Bacillota bacterium]